MVSQNIPTDEPNVLLLSLSVIDTVKSMPGFLSHNDSLERMTCDTDKVFITQLGNFVILKKNLDLIEKIGEGMNQLVSSEKLKLMS